MERQLLRGYWKSIIFIVNPERIAKLNAQIWGE